MAEVIKDFGSYTEWFVGHLTDEEDKAAYRDPEERGGMLEDFHSWYMANGDEPHSVRDLVACLLLDPPLYDHVGGLVAASLFRDFQIHEAVEEITRDPNS